MLRRSPAAQLVTMLALAATLTGTARAVTIPQETAGTLAGRAFVAPQIAVSEDIETLDGVRSVVGAALQNRFDDFAVAAGGTWTADVDKRTGMVVYAEGAGVPWVPGQGNRLEAPVVAGVRAGALDLAAMEQVARGFLPRVADMLGVDPRELRLNHGRSGQPAPHVWFVDFDVVRGGMPVEGARVVFRVNNGNLIQFGSENLPPRGARVPAAKLDRPAARAVLADFIGGFHPGDQWVDRGSLHLLPVNQTDAVAAEGYRMGTGRGLALVWQITFRRPGELGTWRGRVDATSGEVLEFHDLNEYGSVTGGAYAGDRPTAEAVVPMPFANVATSTYTNSAGIFTGTTGTTSLNGKYVRITDSCGAVSKAADASGLIALGSGTGTDCTTPGTGGAGNTHAARTQFYMVNRAAEVGRGWLPSNSWLAAQLTVNVNLNQTCNAYWNGSTINFFRSGGGCANTGELPGVSLHEWGHGLDSNDGSGSSADNGTGETYGDFTAALATHNSCVGAGFLSSNCGGYGNACTSCTGIREIDWAKHVANTPSTVANFTQTKCPQPSSQAPNYVGPCGKDAIARNQTTKKREGHCESLVSSEAMWDLAARDLPTPNTGAAWAVADRLWYLSRSTATKAFQCNVSTTTWTSNGCFTGSYFRTLRAVDDDNGNLADGTPHGGAIAAAFNRHGIACTTDAGWNVTFKGVASPAVPALTATAGANSASLGWSGSSGVYDVYRNERGCNAGFTKVANDVATTSYTDNAVANGFTYYYQVVAQPSGNEAAASAPSTCRSVTPTGSSTCTPPAAPTGVTASAASTSQINLAWTASSGATSYNVLRSTTSGSGYASVGTATTTSFANTGLACGTTYYYVLQASNGTCASGNSAQAQATTSACDNTLQNGVAKTGLSAATGAQTTYTMAVPAGATNLKFTTSGGTGDLDLYVKFGSAPTTSSYTCRSWASGNTETCSITTAQAGTYYVMLHAYAAYSGASLTGSYTAGTTNTPPVANFTFTTSGLTASFTDTSTDANGTIASRSWNFGDGTTSTTANPSKTYAAAGTYTVSLTVTDNGGATASTSKSVTVASTSTDPCTSCTKYTGSLSGTGASAIQPNGTYYQSTVSGSHQGWLQGPAGTDFDLELYKWNGSAWSRVASSAGSTSTEAITYSGTSGYYYFKILSYSGSGAYSFWLKKP